MIEGTERVPELASAWIRILRDTVMLAGLSEAVRSVEHPSALPTTAALAEFQEIIHSWDIEPDGLERAACLTLPLPEELPGGASVPPAANIAALLDEAGHSATFVLNDLGYDELHLLASWALVAGWSLSLDAEGAALAARSGQAWPDFRPTILHNVRAGLAIVHACSGRASAMQEALREVARSRDSLGDRILELGAASEAGLVETLADLRVGRLANVRAQSPSPLPPATRLLRELGPTASPETRSLACAYITAVLVAPEHDRPRIISLVLHSFVRAFERARTHRDAEELGSALELFLLTDYPIPVDLRGTLVSEASELLLKSIDSWHRAKALGDSEEHAAWVNRSDGHRLTLCRVILVTWMNTARSVDGLDGPPWEHENVQRANDEVLLPWMAENLERITMGHEADPAHGLQYHATNLLYLLAWGLVEEARVAIAEQPGGELSAPNAESPPTRMSPLSDIIERSLRLLDIIDLPNREHGACPSEILALRIRHALRFGGPDFDETLQRDVAFSIEHPELRTTVGLPTPFLEPLSRCIASYVASRGDGDQLLQALRAEAANSAADFHDGFILWGEASALNGTQDNQKDEGRRAVARRHQSRLLFLYPKYTWLVRVGDRELDHPAAARFEGVPRITSIRPTPTAPGNPIPPVEATNAPLLVIVRGLGAVVVGAFTDRTSWVSSQPCSMVMWRRVVHGARRGPSALSGLLALAIENAGIHAGSDAPFRIAVDPQLYPRIRGDLQVGRGARQDATLPNGRLPVLDDFGPWSIDPLFRQDVQGHPSSRYWVGIESTTNPLPRAHAELSAALAVARASSTRECSIIPIGSDPAEVIAAWPSADLIHIAAHGVLPRANPLLGFWDFGDGCRVTAGDLAASRRSSDPIVILSNCSGADAAMANGLGLATASLLAGARAVVAVHGPMPEFDAVMMCMVSRRLARGEPVASAVRDVRRQFAQQPHHEARLLQVYGDPMARAAP